MSLASNVGGIKLSIQTNFWIYWALTLKLLVQICHSPYCQPYNSCNVSSENLELDQLIIPKLIFFFILITCLLNIVLILQREILSWSLIKVHVVTERYNKLLYLLVWSMFSWQVKSKDNKMSLFLCQMEPILGITLTLFGIQNGYEHLTLKKYCESCVLC